jgi:hypothetical protein
LIRWKKKLLVLATVFGIAGILFCKSGPTGPAVSQTALSEFYLTTQVDGWVPDDSSHLAVLPVSALFNAIDGDAVTYRSAGLKYWLLETMNGGLNHDSAHGDYNFAGYAEDYGNAANSKAIFDKITSVHVVQNPLDTNFSDTVQLAGFSLAEAQAVRIQGGIDVYGTFEKYYFQFELTGYADPTAAAPDAVKFLTEYKALAQ